MSYTKYEVRVYDDGSKHWWLNGQRHRADGPAVECASGTKAWYLNDKLHRTDGPAVEYTNGDKSWYLNDKYYTEAEYNAKVQTKDNKDKDCANQVVTIDGVEYALTPVTKD